MGRPKTKRKKVPGTRQRSRPKSRKPTVICLAEAFGPTVIGLGFQQYEQAQTSPYAFDQGERKYEGREKLLQQIGCDNAEADRALDDCEQLYVTLTMTIDQSPELKPLHNFAGHLEKFRRRVEAMQNELHRLRTQNAALAYADEFKFEGERSENSGDDAIILYGPLLESLREPLRALSEHLEPISRRLTSVPKSSGRGRHRKYSLGFAIMRLAQIYNRYGENQPRPGVSVVMLPTPRYTGPFFRFVAGFFNAIDKPYPFRTAQSLGRTIQEGLQVWERDKDLHLLINSKAETKDIISFVKRYDEIRADLGFLPAL